MVDTKHVTSESVLPGHPDKLADQIADAVLDDLIRYDPKAHVACEVLVSRSKIYLAGEVSEVASDGHYIDIVHQVLSRVKVPDYWPDIVVDLHPQSLNIQQTARCGFAGDQGIVYGFACDETPSQMPTSIVLVHDIARYLSSCQGAGPDGKVQITIAHEHVDNIYVSAHVPNRANESKLSAELFTYLRAVAPGAEYRLSVFEKGGPLSDTGLTGRKLQVDTYGTVARHGGGALSGKDCTKMDRTGAYLARAVAKHVLRRWDLEWVEVGLAYGFDQRAPLWIQIWNDRDLYIPWSVVGWDLSIEAAIERFDLRRPIYSPTAVYGHFGRDEFSWENYVEAR